MRYLFAILLYLGFCNSAYATSIDSLSLLYNTNQNHQKKIELCLEIANQYSQNNKLDSAILFTNEAIKLAKKYDFKPLLVTSYITSASLLINNNQFSNSDSLLNEALELKPDRKTVARIYLLKFNTDFRKGEPQIGVDDLQEARKYIGNDTLSEQMVRYSKSYGTYFLYQSQLPKALNWLLKAKRLEEKGNFGLATLINHDLATIYLQFQAYDQALAIIKENEEIAIKNQDHVRELFSLYTIATIYTGLEDFSKVKSTCYRAIQLKEEHTISTAFGYVYYQLGTAFLKENKLDSAIYYFQQGITISELQNEKKELSDCHKGMGEAFLMKNNLDNAKLHFEKAKLFRSYYDNELNFFQAEINAQKGNYQDAFKILSDGYHSQAEEDNNNAEYQIISALLNEKFEQERIQEHLIYQQGLAKRTFYGVLIFLLAGLSALLYIIYNQSRSKKKLELLNSELERRNQDLNYFAYIASHDLKEPIRNISSFTGLIKAELKDDNIDVVALREKLGFILNGSQTLHQIIESLRIYTNIASNTVAYELVDIAKVFRTVENNVAKTVEEKNGQLTFHNPHKIERVHFSTPMLILILQNLIQNGFKFNESETPSVNVKLYPENDKIIFAIIDNGIGIEAPFQEKVFHPFKTLKNKSLTHSSGLGLAICKTILDKFGNKIWLESNGKEGSQFYFSVNK